MSKIRDRTLAVSFCHGQNSILGRRLLLRNSFCNGWLERETEEGSLLAQGALLALASEDRIAELGGIESGAGLNHGVEDSRQLVGQGRDGSGRAEFGAHASEEIAQH